MKKKIIKCLKNLDYYMQPVLIITLLLAALIQVLYRFVPFIKAPWTLELITFLFSSSVWFGVSIAIKEDAHVGIQAVYRHFPHKVQRLLKIFNNLLFAAMLIILGYWGTEALGGYYRSQTLAPATHLPYWFLRSPILFGVILSLYRLVENLLRILKGQDPEFIQLATEKEDSQIKNEKLEAI